MARSANAICRAASAWLGCASSRCKQLETESVERSAILARPPLARTCYSLPTIEEIDQGQGGSSLCYDSRRSRSRSNCAENEHRGTSKRFERALSAPLRARMRRHAGLRRDSSGNVQILLASEALASNRVPLPFRGNCNDAFVTLNVWKSDEKA